MKRLPKVLALTAAVLASASVHALPTIVTDWSYSLATTWTDATSEQPATLTGVGTKQLKWGTVSPLSTNGLQSALTIGPDPDPSGTVDTFIGSPANSQLEVNSAFWADGNSLTHSNNVIRPNTSLLTAQLSSTLTLAALNPAPGLPFDVLPQLQIDIKFKETPNSGTCAAASATPCRDIFTVVGGSLNTSFFYDADGTGAQQYFVGIFAPPPSVIPGNGVLGFLPDSVCAAAGEAPGCFGFTTEENQENTLQFAFTVSTQQQQIPEPASLALVGLALLGVGMARRQSARKA